MKRLFLFLSAMLIFCIAACGTPPYIYQPTPAYYTENQIAFNDGPQIEHGKYNPIVDGINHYLFSLPTKFILWNWSALDHRFEDEDKAILELYLEMNGLQSVKIRHNQYAPIDEFRRLTRNTQVGRGYRYTLGFILWLRYTLFPDRLFAGLPVPFIGGGDHFNPFTNTVNVYSSDISILLHEVGHAKDYLQHEMKGTSFAMIRMLPGMDLMQEARASSDAIRFLYCIKRSNDELRAYRTLIPAYSTYITGYFYGGLIVSAPIVIAGHVTGRAQAHQRMKELEAEKNGKGVSLFHRRKFLPTCCKPFIYEGQNQ